MHAWFTWSQKLILLFFWLNNSWSDVILLGMMQDSKQNTARFLNIWYKPVFALLYFWMNMTNLWSVISILTKAGMVRLRKWFRCCNIENTTALGWAPLSAIRSSCLETISCPREKTQKFESWIMYTRQKETLNKVIGPMATYSKTVKKLLPPEKLSSGVCSHVVFSLKHFFMPSSSHPKTARISLRWFTVTVSLEECHNCQAR